MSAQWNPVYLSASLSDFDCAKCVTVKLVPFTHLHITDEPDKRKTCGMMVCLKNSTHEVSLTQKRLIKIALHCNSNQTKQLKGDVGNTASHISSLFTK